jgi:hypothetical protein
MGDGDRNLPRVRLDKGCQRENSGKAESGQNGYDDKKPE